jgi:glutaredoxin-related protein
MSTSSLRTISYIHGLHLEHGRDYLMFTQRLPILPTCGFSQKMIDTVVKCKILRDDSPGLEDILV